MATGVKVSSLTIDDSPSLNDWLYSIDLAASPTSRRIQIGELLALITSGISAPYLNASTSIGATSTSVSGLPTWAATNLFWGVFDPGGIECEVRKLTVNGSTVSWSGGLAYAHSEGDPVLLVTSPMLNVKWFGARGDGVTDDRIALNRAVAQLTVGSGLYAPAGTYRCRPAGSNPQMVNLSGKTDILIYGDGPETVFELDPTYNWASLSPDAHYFLCVGSKRITFRDFKIDGQWRAIQLLNPSLNEQMHGIYLAGISVYGQAAGAAEDITIENVWLYNLRGDGIYCIGNDVTPVDTVKVLHSKFEDNGRSGAAHQSAVNLWYDDCDFSGMADQDLDFEVTSPLPLEHIFINKCRFNHSTPTLSVALTGFGTDNRMSHVKFTDNDMNGALFMRFVDDVVISGNTIIGPADNRAVDLAAGCSNVLIAHNPYIEGNYAGANAIHIDVGASVVSENVTVEVNNVKQNANGNGILCLGVRQTAVIKGNTVIGSGSSGTAGIYLGVESAIGTMYDYAAEGNTIKNFAVGCTLRCGQNATNEINTASISHNRFVDTQVTPTQITGVHLDSNNNANFIENQSLLITGNVFGRGITTPISNTAGVTPICIGGVGASNGGLDGVGQWLSIGTPENAVTARIGSVDYRSDGGAGTSFYVKESGTGNTGWVAK